MLKSFYLPFWKSLFFLLGFLPCSNTFSQSDLISRSLMLQDVNQLESQLLKIHPGLHTFTSPQAISAIFEQLRTGLPQQLTRTEFLAGLNIIIKSIQCGHTSFVAEPTKRRFSSAHKKMKGLFPISLKLIENKVIIRQNFSLDTINIKEGDELLKINNIDIKDILSVLSIVNGGSDGENTGGQIYYTLKRFSKAYRMLYGAQEQFKVKTYDRNLDRTKELTVESITVKEQKERIKLRYPQQKPPPFELRQIAGMENALILDLNNFTSSKIDLFQLGYKSRLKRVFKSIEESNNDYLIIDLRGNPGGMIENTIKFLRYIHPQTFPLIKEAKINRQFVKGKTRLFEKLRILFYCKKEKTKEYILLKKFTGKTYRPSRKFNYKGKVILLIDAGSFSASATAALSIKSQDRGILIGEEAGGSFHFVNGGNYHFLKLKNSKLQIRIPTIHIAYEVDPTKQSSKNGVLPDITVQQKLIDADKGIDTQMEAAIQLIQQFEKL